MSTDRAAELVAACRCLDREGLVTAFGHVSARGEDDVLITRGIPLGRIVDPSGLTRLGSRGEAGDGAPGEHWLHGAVYERRSDVEAICRAQPPAAEALGVSGIPLFIRHGQGALVGEIALSEDARLARGPEIAAGVADALGDRDAVLLRGNGALTTGASVGEAVARMWLLERSAKILLRTAGAPAAYRLTDLERTAWESVSPELLARIWSYLTTRRQSSST